MWKFSSPFRSFTRPANSIFILWLIILILIKAHVTNMFCFSWYYLVLFRVNCLVSNVFSAGFTQTNKLVTIITHYFLFKNQLSDYFYRNSNSTIVESLFFCKLFWHILQGGKLSVFHVDSRDDFGVSAIWLKLDIRAKEGGEGGKKQQKGQMKNREKSGCIFRAFSLKATLNPRVQSITGGDEIQSQKCGLMRNKLGPRCITLLVRAAHSQTRICQIN